MDGSIECRAAKYGSEGTSGRPAAVNAVPPVPVLMGPTGSGKTEAALAIARGFPLVAICADLRQAMRGMAIGSAQPSNEEVDILPHKLCGVLDPATDITVDVWRKLAVSEILNVLGERKIPLILGGSGLAVKALIEGAEFDAPPAPVLRKALSKAFEMSGIDYLVSYFGPLLGGLLKESEIKNPYRVIRSIERYAWNSREVSVPELADRNLEEAWISQLEMWNRTGVAATNPDRACGENSGLEFKIFSLYPERDWLAKRIFNRAQAMFQNGLLEEVKTLLANGVSRDARSLKGHGYPEAIAVLDGEMTVEDAIIKTAAVTRKYAKRQITWLKHQFEEVTFLPVGEDIRPEDAAKPIAEFLSECWAAFIESNRRAEHD